MIRSGRDNCPGESICLCDVCIFVYMTVWKDTVLHLVTVRPTGSCSLAQPQEAVGTPSSCCCPKISQDDRGEVAGEVRVRNLEECFTRLRRGEVLQVAHRRAGQPRTDFTIPNHGSQEYSGVQLRNDGFESKPIFQHRTCQDYLVATVFTISLLVFVKHSSKRDIATRWTFVRYCRPTNTRLE
jgi:hypothetical protein